MKHDKLRLVFDVHRTVHNIGIQLSRYKKGAVTQAEAIILAYLHEEHTATMSDLHHAFGHKRSTLTGVVERLVTRGFVKRALSPKDRRSFIVTLSGKGVAAAREVHGRLSVLEDAALRNVPERDVAYICDVIARLGTR
jgi:DNA-binding MarR family transcriptional regulator